VSRTPGGAPRRRPTPPAAVFLFLFVLTLLVSCSNDYLLVADPVFETLFAPGNVGKERIRKQIEEKTNRSVGWAPSLSFDGNLGNQIDSILSSETPNKGVILAPLLFREAPALASGYPELGFLLLAEAPDEPANLMSIRFDRVEALDRKSVV
jgi:hypothetical protein